MRYVLIALMIGMTLVGIVPNVHAQYTGLLPSNANITACTQFMFPDVQNPMTVTIDHDPAIRKQISYSTSNPNAGLNMLGNDPNQVMRNETINPKTHMSFTSNDTTNWQILIQIDHPHDRITTRTLTVNLFDKPIQTPESTEVVKYNGDYWCGLFQINAQPPIHIPTSQEIVKLAQSYTNATLTDYELKVRNYAGAAQGSAEASNGLSALTIIVLLVSIVIIRSDHRNVKDEIDAAKLDQLAFKNMMEVVKKKDQYREIRTEDTRRNLDEKMSDLMQKVANASNMTNRNITYALEDMIIVLKQNLGKNVAEKFRVLEKIEPIIILPEQTPEIKDKGKEEDMKARFSKIPVVGSAAVKLAEVLKDEGNKKKGSERAVFWFEEYKKGINGKYLGQWNKIWDENYDGAVKDPKSEERAKIDALYMILEENNGRWPN